eukprot:SAG22_NODE_467_length_10171_cov_4.306295_18_plen_84_part_00
MASACCPPVRCSPATAVHISKHGLSHRKMEVSWANRVLTLTVQPRHSSHPASDSIIAAWPPPRIEKEGRSAAGAPEEVRARAG